MLYPSRDKGSPLQIKKSIKRSQTATRRLSSCPATRTPRPPNLTTRLSGRATLNIPPTASKMSDIPPGEYSTPEIDRDCSLFGEIIQGIFKIYGSHSSENTSDVAIIQLDGTKSSEEENQTDFRCPHCGNELKSEKSLRQHIKRHETKDIWICSRHKCGMSYQSADLKDTQLHTSSNDFLLRN
ncbi:Hypothetical predicted protein [Cloeon dipterum]|uniref:C2H2-type domain-containing protein n=1 Tax=Cloeon dipterum TaxID=197152 RepID=A0A8S1DUT7_9INSE|nr:Hypothetical predicted protein [Cloeon dipterum]